jgi:hypothetical protein
MLPVTVICANNGALNSMVKDRQNNILVFLSVDISNPFRW